MSRQTFSSVTAAELVSWAWWVLASTVGAAVGLILSYAWLRVAVVAFGANEDRIAMNVFVPLMAICIGIAQWLVMRRHTRRAGWWLVASIAGWIVGAAAIIVTSSVVSSVVPMGILNEIVTGTAGTVVALALLGAVIGITQWLYLRRHFTRAGWWVLASLAGWALLGVLAGRSFSDLAEMTGVGTVPALTTGCVLVWLLRQRHTGVLGFHGPT